jgi:hypothetical protein
LQVRADRQQQNQCFSPNFDLRRFEAANERNPWARTCQLYWPSPEHIQAPPTSSQWEKYNRRCQRKKLGKDFLLHQNCSDTYYKLEYLPLNANKDYCPRYVRREHPCAEEGRCGCVDCFDGHICQRESCAKGIHKTTCTLMHDVAPYEPQIPELNLIDL